MDDTVRRATFSAMRSAAVRFCPRNADASAFLGQNRTAADRIAENVARRTVSSILEAF